MSGVGNPKDVKKIAGADQDTTAVQEEEEDDEDAQTFIIQLTEEQTKQLSKGTLKLNGVPIPKDLNNLSYEQIMALLDSVNLPSTNQKKTNEKNAVAQEKASPFNKRKADQNNISQTTGKRATPGIRGKISQEQKIG